MAQCHMKIIQSICIIITLQVSHSLSTRISRQSCICTKIYQPICGSDNKTYGNECLLKCANDGNKKGKSIKIWYPGECKEDDSCICTEEYDPVCGSDNITYSNECLLECASENNIKNGKPPITVAYEGKCKEDDSCICPENYDPVCGSDMITYSNKCFLKCASDQNVKYGKPPITVAYEGECKEENPCFCPFIYDPVCGSNNKTYNNECLLKCASKENIKNGKPPIIFAYEGECKPKDAPCICPYNYAPVCGTNMITYGNKCVLNCASIKNVRNGKPPIKIAYEGQCRDHDYDSCICPYIYQRVCGSDKVTYGNKCVLKCASTKNVKNGKPPITIEYDGPCKGEDQERDSCFCPFIYKPVCGSDTITYNNECLLKCASRNNIKNGKPPITVAYKGQCKIPDPDKDSCICPFIYRPLCGSDMITYSNECLLKCASRINVKNGKPPITIAYEGKCHHYGETPIQHRNESCVCPLIEESVCGSDHITYTNECFLKCASYNNTKYNNHPIYVHYEGKCKNSKHCICPEIYQPVCGIDGVTYGNECELNCKNYELEQHGKNPVAIISYGKCPEACICVDVYEPVCGSDGKTYPNKCELSCINKKYGHKDSFIKIVYPGICNNECDCKFEKEEVCGSDGQTYGNVCELACESKKLEQAGLSPIALYKRERCQYPCDCPNIIQPVCGSNHKSYKNYCILECVNNNVIHHVMYNGYIPNQYGNIGYENYANDQYGHDIYKQNEYPYDHHVFGGYLYNRYKRESNDKNIKYTKNEQNENDNKAEQNEPEPSYYSGNINDEKHETEENIPITVEYVGLCRDCFCFDIYSPVCGSDGKTYETECQLNCRNKKLKKLGEKPIYVAYPGKCNHCYCPDVFIPVCGSDGNTYTNTCYMECENKKHEKDKSVALKYLGVCHDEH